MKSLKLPFTFNVDRMVSEISQVPHADYREANSTICTPKKVWVLDLIEPIDSKENRTFQEKEWLKKLPYLREIYDTFECPRELLRVHRLASKGKLRRHRDMGINYENNRLRIHVPVITNPQATFQVEDEVIHMGAGECWYVDVDLFHQVANQGPEDRVHIIVDCLRNEWWDNLFADLGYKNENNRPYGRMPIEELKNFYTQIKSTGIPNLQEILSDIEEELSLRSE